MNRDFPGRFGDAFLLIAEGVGFVAFMAALYMLIVLFAAVVGAL